MRDQERFREYTAALWAGRGQYEARQTQVSAEALGGYVDVLVPAPRTSGGAGNPGFGIAPAGCE